MDDRTTDEPYLSFRGLAGVSPEVTGLDGHGESHPAADVVLKVGQTSVPVECKVVTRTRAGVTDHQRVVEEFSDFYRSHSTRLAAFLRAIGVPQADALEIMQETMLKALRRWETIASPWAWVKVTASREYAARLARGEPVPVEDIADRMPAAPSGSAFADTKHDILRAMQQLPLRQRQVLAWSFEGHSPAEIAAHLRMTPEAVRSSLHKGRKSLLELLQAHEPGNE